MRNLLRAELTRFTSRKIVWIVLGLTFLALAGLVALSSTSTADPGPAARAAAQQAYDTSHQDWVANHEANDEECRAQTPPSQQQYCTSVEPQLSDFLFQAKFSEIGPSVAQAAAGFFGLAAAIVASSLIAADFSTGAMANWLSFIPVRWRVFSSKLIVGVGAPTLLAAVLMAPPLLVFGLVVTAQQGAAAVTGWDTVWSIYGRGVAVVAFGAVLGATIAFLTRRTIAAVGIILGYFVAKLVLSGIFGLSAWYVRLTPWIPEDNALALLMGDYKYQIPKQTVTPDGIDVQYTEAVVTWEHGLVYLLVGSAVLVGVALVTFQRRDVT